MNEPDNTQRVSSQAKLSDANLHGAELIATGSSKAEFDRLLTAVVVSKQFRQMLLATPSQAIGAGYENEKFHFLPSELKLLLSIKARTIEEFAQALLAHRESSLEQ